MKTTIVASAVAAALAMPGVASAYQTSAGDFYAYADVVSVQPVYRTVRVDQPRRECRDEQVYVVDSGYNGRRTKTPEILGAIIGAGLGRQFGSGRGQDVATVAGAVLGGSIGHDVKNRHYNQGSGQSGHYESVQKCQIINDYHTEEQSDGFDVIYQYDGHQYKTRTSYHPGETLKVRVGVTPAQ